MAMVNIHVPLTDVTNLQVVNFQKPRQLQDVCAYQLQNSPKIRRNNPYAWKCLKDTEPAISISQKPRTAQVPHTQELFQDKDDQAPPPPAGQPICNAVIQFKCHQAEYSSTLLIDKGQYVVVQGDRGIDIGAVVRINTENTNAYVERTRSAGSVLRFATQREVDYWATDLKESENRAVEFCQHQIHRHSFDMRIVQAEYQFDQKKLTFYYEARERIDFVQLLKELYREFGCRIWMEKVKAQS